MKVIEQNTMSSFSKNTICRICMQVDKNLFPIFNKIFLGHDKTITIAEILSEFSKYPVTSNDQLPAQVCYSCMTQTHSVHQFKRKIEEAYCYLKALYDKTWTPEQMVRRNLVEKSVGSTTTNKYKQTEKTITFSCKFCLKKFLFQSDLRQHCVTSHPNSQSKCRLCGKRFIKLRQLKAHFSTNHPNDFVYCELKCNVCSLVFNRKYNYKRHLRKMHNINDVAININNISSNEPEIETAEQTNVNNANRHCPDSQEDNGKKMPVNNSKTTTNSCHNKNNNSDSQSLNTTMENIENDRAFMENISEPELSLKPEPIEIIDSSDDMDETNTETKQIISVDDENVANDDMHETHIETRLINLEEDEDFDNCIKDKVEDENKAMMSNKTNGRKTFKYKNHDDIHETNIETRLINLEEDEDFDNCIKDKVEDENKAMMKNKKKARKTLKSIKVENKKNTVTIMHKCVECPLEFKLLGNLNRHMRTHTCKASFTCQICSVSFTRRDNLRKHLKFIHGEKKFACDTCNKKFAARYRLLQHIQTESHKKLSTQ